jgi:hypothetical protein
MPQPEQVTDGGNTDSDRPRSRASHIVVRRTVSDDGTVTGITARTESSIRSPKAVLGITAIVSVVVALVFLIQALTAKHDRWTDLGLAIFMAAVSILPLRVYLRYRRHQPMLIVNSTGITCWSVSGRTRPASASANDIASVVSCNRPAGGRSVRWIVTMRVTRNDGTSFWTDSVTAPETSPDERAILDDLIGQIRAILRLQPASPTPTP